MKEYLKMLKFLVFVFFVSETVRRVMSRKANEKGSSCDGNKDAENTVSVKTERLVITPMTGDELAALIAETDKTDKETADAYRDMLRESTANPDAFLWYTAWKIASAETGEMLGDVCFKGLPENGHPEIGYGIIEKHRRNGYATEAVGAMCDWALGHENVKAVDAETAPDNAPSQRILAKLGFVPTGENGEEGPRFVKTGEKQAKN